MCWDCTKKDIEFEAKELGIEVTFSFIEHGPIWFKSEEDLNLFKLSSKYLKSIESISVKLEVDKLGYKKQREQGMVL